MNMVYQFQAQYKHYGDADITYTLTTSLPLLLF